ncbi:MAG: hypothetical protein K2X43_22415 [Hyphomonadaceae bacterium]|nr:hypothetical protein [Hyphomonadaceae bacterium]
MMKVAAHGAIGALAGLLLSTVSAQAADLGGNCCADLEERVAELEAITARKGNRRMSLTVSGQVNRSVMYYDDGFAKAPLSVDNSNTSSRVQFAGSARINPALSAGFLLQFDLNTCGRSHQANQVDDDGCGSPVTLNADGLGGAGDSLVGLTLANWYLTHNHWGTLTVGRLNTAASGSTTVDLGGIGVIANSQPIPGFGMLLRSGTGLLATYKGAAGAGTWGGLNCGAGQAGFGGVYQADCGFSALARRDGVSYSTPTWQGFSVSAAWGESNYWDAALRYAGEGGGFRFAAALAYRKFTDQEGDAQNAVPVPGGPQKDTDRRSIQGSASIMHVATGLFLNGAAMRYEFNGANIGETIGAVAGGPNRPDVNMWYLAGGITRNWFGIGNTAIYGEYGKYSDGITGLMAAASIDGLGATGTVLDSEHSWWGVGIVQNIDAAAMELYVGYRKYSADVVTSGVQIQGGIEDLSIIQAGARVQF